MPKKAEFVKTALCGLLFACSGPHPPEQAMPAKVSTGIHGTITDADGQPVAGANIYAYRNARSGLRGPAKTVAQRLGTAGPVPLDQKHRAFRKGHAVEAHVQTERRIPPQQLGYEPILHTHRRKAELQVAARQFAVAFAGREQLDRDE